MSPSVASLCGFFFFNDTATTEIYTLSLHDALPISIAVDNAEINGRFEGELTVRKQLTIHGTGKVSGKIRYAKIKIEEGAELAGEISVLDKSQSSASAAKRVGGALTN